MTDTRTSVVPRRLTALALAGLLGLGSVTGIAACSDEDGDGGETDEEIKDVEDGVDEGVDDVKEEVDEETDALNEGDNENDDKD
jgi:hypothetical protein